MTSLAKLFFYWPAAEPLADARGTLGFSGTPVENHWFRDSLQQQLRFLFSKAQVAFMYAYVNVFEAHLVCTSY